MYAHATYTHIHGAYVYANTRTYAHAYPNTISLQGVCVYACRRVDVGTYTNALSMQGLCVYAACTETQGSNSVYPCTGVRRSVVCRHFVEQTDASRQLYALPLYTPNDNVQKIGVQQRLGSVSRRAMQATFA